jgi:hypothetical protein
MGESWGITQPKVKSQVTCHQDSLVNDYTGYRKRIPMIAGSAGSASSSGRHTCRHHRCHYSGAWAAKPMFRANASNLLLPAQTIHHAPQYTTKVHDVLTCHKSTNKLSLKKPDAAHEPECNHVDHFCGKKCSNSIVDFPPVTVQVHCRRGVQSAAREESGVLSGACSV